MVQRDDGRLASRPATPGGAAVPARAVAPGLSPLGLGGKRDGLVFVPQGYQADVAAPLSVKLHGAGGNATGALAPFLPLADPAGMLLLAVDSRGPTWDVIRSGFGPDIAFLDEALAAVFDRFTVDADRISIEGFSDGASYALSVGLVNGDLFRRVVAFSPGFMVVPERHGPPAVFVSHGIRDRVLPIDRCSRRLVPRLREAGLDVTYREFDGGHIVPPEIAAEAESWAGAGAR